MGNDKWFNENGIAEKIRVAVEDLRIGRGLNVAFRGLERGSCLVELVDTGTGVVFVNKMPEEKPVEPELLTIEENAVSGAGEEGITTPQEQEVFDTAEKMNEVFPKKSFLEEVTTESEPVEEEKPKKKRKTTVENSES